MNVTSTFRADDGGFPSRDGVFWLVLLLLGVVPQVFGPNYLDSADLPKLALIQLGSILVLLLWLIASARSGSLTLRKDVFTLSLLALLLWAGLSLVWSENWYVGAERVVHWAACFIFYFVFAQLIQAEKDIRRLFGAVALSGLVTAILGLLQAFTGFDWVAQAVPPAAAFANKNVAAQFIVLALPCVLFFWLDARTKLSTWIWTGCIAAILVYFSLTTAKAAWLAVSVEVILLVVFLLALRKASVCSSLGLKLKLASLLLCVFLVPLTVRVALPNFQWPVREAYSSIVRSFETLYRGSESTSGSAMSEKVKPALYRSSLGIRLTLWVNTLAMVKDHPVLGVGIGNFSTYYPRYYRAYLKETHRLDRYHVMRAHNDYVQILAELGFVGLFLVGFLGYRVVSIGLSSLSRGRSGQPGLMILCLFTAVIGVAVNAFFSFPFQNAVPPLLLAVLLAALGWYGATGCREMGTCIVSSLKCSYSLIAFTLLLLSVGIVLQARRLRGDYYLLKSVEYEMAADWINAVAAGERSYRFNRYPVELHFRLGQYYIEAGQYKKAIDLLESGLDNHPYYVTGFYNLGLAYYRIQEYRAALANFNKAIEIYPDLDRAHHMAGATLQELGNLEAAEESVRLALSQNPNEPEYYFSLGRICLRQGRFREASRNLRIAVEAEPANAAYQLLAGIADQANGSFGQAVERYRLALELKPGWDEAHMRLGMALISIGGKEEGIANLSKALQLNPNASWATDVLSTLHVLGVRIEARIPPGPPGGFK